VAIVTSLPLSIIFRTVWDDLGEVSVRLRRQSVIGLSIVMLFTFIGSVPAIAGNRVLSEAFGLMSTLALLPFEIAIYRLLILDEAASGYEFAISTVRFQRLLGWHIALWALVTIPTYLAAALAPSAGAELVLNLAMVVVGIVVMVRLAILLPAIAVGAPGASVKNALADTRGQAWLIFKAYFAIVLPSVLIIFLAVVLVALGGVSGALGRSGAAAASSAFFGALGFVTVSAIAIVSARLFMSLGERVKDEPTAASPL
jgi:hypothetical protein